VLTGTHRERNSRLLEREKRPRGLSEGYRRPLRIRDAGCIGSANSLSRNPKVDGTSGSNCCKSLQGGHLRSKLRIVLEKFAFLESDSPSFHNARTQPMLCVAASSSEIDGVRGGGVRSSSYGASLPECFLLSSRIRPASCPSRSSPAIGPNHRFSREKGRLARGQVEGTPRPIVRGFIRLEVASGLQSL